jgi:hypothetical protein
MQIDRALALVICGLGLEACSSSPSGIDAFRLKPTTTELLTQSNPAGADARSSLGGTCRTPCTTAIGTDGDFTISFAHHGYETQTDSSLDHVRARPHDGTYAGVSAQSSLCNAGAPGKRGREAAASNPSGAAVGVWKAPD